MPCFKKVAVVESIQNWVQVSFDVFRYDYLGSGK